MGIHALRRCQTCKEVKARTDYYAGNYPRCKVCDRKAQKKYKTESPYKFRAAAHKKRIKHSYGLEIEDYNKLCAEQFNVCKLCDKDNKGWRLAIDHNHETGKIRGLLCNQCNRAIGLFKDSPDLLNKAASYLRESMTH